MSEAAASHLAWFHSVKGKEFGKWVGGIGIAVGAVCVVAGIVLSRRMSDTSHPLPAIPAEPDTPETDITTLGDTDKEYVVKIRSARHTTEEGKMLVYVHSNVHASQRMYAAQIIPLANHRDDESTQPLAVGSDGDRAPHLSTWSAIVVKDVPVGLSVLKVGLVNRYTGKVLANDTMLLHNWPLDGTHLMRVPGGTFDHELEITYKSEAGLLHIKWDGEYVQSTIAEEEGDANQLVATGGGAYRLVYDALTGEITWTDMRIAVQYTSL